VDEARQYVIVAVVGGGENWLKASVIKESGYKGIYLDDTAYVNVDYITFAGSFEHDH